MDPGVSAMNLITRKKLEIFIESNALAAVERMLSAAGFKGWSVFEGAEGSGAHGRWRQIGIGEDAAYLVVAIGGEAATEAALAWLGDHFKTYPGVAAVSDVAVMRGERF